MATTIARLQAILDADTRGFDAKMKSSQTKTEKFGHIAKTALIGGVAAGITAVGVAAKIGWDEYNQGAKVAAQTNAVIKSTGGVANVTSQHVEDLGHQLMLLSGVDDELIKSGENVMLTFRKVQNEAGKGNDIFDQATKAALDLSVALGTDLQSANIQLGKALNGSTTGLTALTRSGVSFNDKQKETITNLFATGHAMEAQKMILKELTVEFGGSAKAAGETFGGQINIARERLNNFLGDLTEKAIPYLQRFVEWIGPRASKAMEKAREILNELRGDWRKLNAVLDRHHDTVQKVVTVLGFLVEVVKKVVTWQLKFWTTLIKVELKVLDVVLAVGDKLVGAFKSAAGAAKSVWNWIGKVADVLKGPFKTALDIALGPILTLVSWLQTLYDIAKKVAGALSAVQGSRGTGAPTGRGGSGAAAVNPNRATGGPVFAGRAYTVGERGPETFVPRMSGTIIPAGGGTTIINNFNGPALDGDALLRYIRGQADKFERRNGRSAF